MGLSVTLAHARDDVLRHCGRRLRIDDHDAVVADDDAGIGIALCRVGVGALRKPGERDRLVGEVGVRRK